MTATKRLAEGPCPAALRRVARLRRWLAGSAVAALGGGALLVGAPAQAAPAGLAALIAEQSSTAATDSGAQDMRLRKLEAEVRALQRQVFPGGDGTFFPRTQPDTTGTSTATPIGTPATTPVTDLLARMDAVEAQIARLTAQNEEIQNRLRLLENGRASAAPGLAAAPVPAPGGAPAAPAAAPAAAPLGSRPLATAPDQSEELPPPPPAPRAAAGPVAKPSAQRVAAVKAIVKPETGDAGEDEYSYGFKLWEAHFYPEAEQQLKLFVTNYPHHRRISYARNLLGRAYLDDGKPREAADWFLQNYQSGRKGDRAADSLLYLVQSLVMLKDVSRACIALAEFTDNYKTEAAGRLKSQYDTTRATVSCN